jgi:hypothetical protein
LIKECLIDTKENFEDLTTTLNEKELNSKFDNSYGGTKGIAFTAWGPEYVYFPICYDGAEWVGFAPRNPCDIKMHHQGGG